MAITRQLAVKIALTLLLLACAGAFAFSNQFYTQAMVDSFSALMEAARWQRQMSSSTDRFCHSPGESASPALVRGSNRPQRAAHLIESMVYN
jgi:hypothetical protein